MWVKGNRDELKLWAWAVCIFLPRTRVVSSRLCNHLHSEHPGKDFFCLFLKSLTFATYYGTADMGLNRCSSQLMPLSPFHLMPSQLLPSSSAALSFSVSLFLSLSASPCLTLSLCGPVNLCLCLSDSVSFSICICDSLSGSCLSLFVSDSLSLNPGVSQSVSLCLCLQVCLSHWISLYVALQGLYGQVQRSL